MKLKKQNYLNKINAELEEEGQLLRVVSTSTKMITISNGVLVEGVNNCAVFRRRLAHPERLFHKVFDKLYSADLDEVGEAKVILANRKLEGSIKGGHASVRLHGSVGERVRGKPPTQKQIEARAKSSALMKGKKPWNAGLTKNDNESLKKISIQRMGDGNPMFGREHTEEYKRTSSHNLKAKILDGSFTPNTNNRYTHFDCEYNGMKYRSSWEVVFASLNPNFEYESLRIPYIDSEGTHRVYIVDFINRIDKVVVEVKPKSLFSRNKNAKEKNDALIEWGIENGYVVENFNEDSILDRKDDIPYDRFDGDTVEKIKKLINRYETKKKRENRKA